ncbi:hypothetical protein JKP88DRAFT_242280 [Tribonema minus]|uniref:Uncharacterized protein n=1 Tax=Tribonema minus TaxID=303371 RepID=A0A835YL46_9STRA|nr:hypothetical protein JKP88DRAFT_242280 [Tribonema minus]
MKIMLGVALLSVLVTSVTVVQEGAEHAMESAPRLLMDSIRQLVVESADGRGRLHVDVVTSNDGNVFDSKSEHVLLSYQLPSGTISFEVVKDSLRSGHLVIHTTKPGGLIISKEDKRLLRHMRDGIHQREHRRLQNLASANSGNARAMIAAAMADWLLRAPAEHRITSRKVDITVTNTSSKSKTSTREADDGVRCMCPYQGGGVWLAEYEGRGVNYQWERPIGADSDMCSATPSASTKQCCRTLAAAGGGVAMKRIALHCSAEFYLLRSGGRFINDAQPTALQYTYHMARRRSANSRCGAVAYCIATLPPCSAIPRVALLNTECCCRDY